MSSAPVGSGRVAQKARTRAALVAAARSLVADGRMAPTVEDAAAEAGVSRTTAYRYFPNQRALLAAAHPEIEAESLLGPDPPAGARERLAIVLDELVRLTLDWEPQLRTALRLSLEPGTAGDEPLVVRGGRAIGWLEEALAPLRGAVPEAELRRLVLAIRTVCGIEALVWLTDIAGATREDAGATMRWAGEALYEAATAGVSPRSSRTSPSG